MSTITFDTHKFIKRLTTAGMPIQQAEILAEEQSQLIDEKLATKQDLKTMELNLIIKLGTICIGSIGFMAALMQILQK